MQFLDSTDTPSAIVASVHPVSLQPNPSPQFSATANLNGFALSLVAVTALMFLTIRQGIKQEDNRTIALLEQKARLERTFQSHNWSQDYRSDNSL